MNRGKVAILLSTYNGSLFLKEQIESIIKQDYINWELFIRDDGSTDSTIDIIKDYCNRFANFHFIMGKESLGSAKSFLWLLENIEADYYMFCDQDDVWNTDKIKKSLNSLKEIEVPKVASLVFSNAIVVTEDLKIINKSFWIYNKISPSLLLANPDYINVYNSAPGCTMIFNNCLRDIVLKQINNNILMHDWLIMMMALKFGKVNYINEALMLYRQHQYNVVGAKKVTLYNRLLKIFNIKQLLQKQLLVFNFVNSYSNISIFKFYKLKFMFNINRYKN